MPFSHIDPQINKKITLQVAKPKLVSPLTRPTLLSHCICVCFCFYGPFRYNRGRRACSCMTNNNSVCTRFEPSPILIHTHVMLTQDIVVIYSTENCHLWNGSCPDCVEWTSLSRKYGGCDETPTAFII